MKEFVTLDAIKLTEINNNNNNRDQTSTSKHSRDNNHKEPALINRAMVGSKNKMEE